MDGAGNLLHTVGDGTNMVLVSVGDKHSTKLLFVLNQIGKIRDDQVNTVHIFVREPHAAVYDDHISAVFQNGDILTNLIQTAQGYNFQFFSQWDKLLSNMDTTSVQPLAFAQP